MPRVVHFEFEADDLDRAAKFYSDVFGWQAQKWAGPMAYVLLTTGADDLPGINGGIYKREVPVGCEGISACVCTIDVPDVDEFTAKVVSAGGSIKMPKYAIPGIGWHALCKDTEGNTFGIMTSDMNAGTKPTHQG